VRGRLHKNLVDFADTRCRDGLTLDSQRNRAAERLHIVGYLAGEAFRMRWVIERLGKAPMRQLQALDSARRDTLGPQEREHGCLDGADSRRRHRRIELGDFMLRGSDRSRYGPHADTSELADRHRGCFRGVRPGVAMTHASKGSDKAQASGRSPINRAWCRRRRGTCIRSCSWPHRWRVVRLRRRLLPPCSGA
jgi:hypothetical protein